MLAVYFREALHIGPSGEISQGSPRQDSRGNTSQLRCRSAPCDSTRRACRGINRCIHPIPGSTCSLATFSMRKPMQPGQNYNITLITNDGVGLAWLGGAAAPLLAVAPPSSYVFWIVIALSAFSVITVIEGVSALRRKQMPTFVVKAGIPVAMLSLSSGISLAYWLRLA